MFILEYIKMHGLTAKSQWIGSCPITMMKQRRLYNATVTHGEARTLQGDGSDVSLTIPTGSQGVYMTRVHTDHTRFPWVIPNEECIVGPLVEVEHIRTQETDIVHKLKIPHCVRNKKLWKYIKVRKGNPNNGTEFTEIEQRFQPRGDGDYYAIDEKYITIYTSHFTLFTCTSCKKNSCNATVMAFLVGQLRNLTKHRITKVKVKAFLCSELYRIADFKNVC